MLKALKKRGKTCGQYLFSYAEAMAYAREMERRKVKQERKK